MSRYHTRLIQVFGVGMALFLLTATPALVAADATNSSNISSAVTQSYSAEPGVQTGMLVKLNPKAPTYVEPLDAADITSLLGVVVTPGDTNIVITPQNASQQQVLVAASGHYDVLVSNQNGPIKIGDYVTISSLDGVGMKADGDQSEVLGKAAGTFSGTNNTIGSQVLKTTSGRSTTVALGLIPVDMDIESNPLFIRTTDYVPTFLAKTASGVADKPVSALRIYASLSILFAATFVASSLLYSGVRGGMLAVGRNPLSRTSIIRSLTQAMLVGLVIFISALFGVYLLLKF